MNACVSLLIAVSGWIGAANGTAATVADLPAGPAPAPVLAEHFPSPLFAFVWRNWSLVPTERLAKVVGAETGQILEIGKLMGLSDPPTVPQMQWRRSYLTIIRRNWHLLPYEQLLELLDWSPAEMAYTLREDDFLFVKLGHLKPRCAPIRYAPPDSAARERAQWIARVVAESFPDGVLRTEEPLFAFVSELSGPMAQNEVTRQASEAKGAKAPSGFSPRFCYSYFALYGDPLADRRDDSYPDGYLARLSASGVDGVWLQGVLYKMAPFPWQPELSEGWQTRMANLRELVARAKRQGIGIWVYLNEPRAMPLAFFADAKRADLKGATGGDHAVMCTSHPAVQAWLRDAVASICREVPDLAGFFTITASENLTNCWSHFGGANCPRCGPRGGAAVVAEVNRIIEEGMRASGSDARLLAWDWGWPDDWAEPGIAALPPGVGLMSVSEWSTPFTRGGVSSAVGEYSISVVGPGPRARRHWEIARRHGVHAIAKIQAGNTWELSAVPYIPAVANVARHLAGLREEKVDGLMLGWTLGGYPSPNLEVAGELARDAACTADQALLRVATRRFGAEAAARVVAAWQVMSEGFSEFPYHGSVVYNAPLQMGPANPLWLGRTGYRATMVGFPYDDLPTWRANYPAEVFIGQLEKVAAGFDQGTAMLRAVLSTAGVADSGPVIALRRALAREADVAEAAGIHFRSVAQQARFVVTRDNAAEATDPASAAAHQGELRRMLQKEIELALRLHAIQARDSRIGFEASNQYYYVPLDLAEKVINCRYLLERDGAGR